MSQPQLNLWDVITVHNENFQALGYKAIKIQSISQLPHVYHVLTFQELDEIIAQAWKRIGV